jgi:Fic family protein
VDSYQPPFEITTKMIHQISSISEQIGRLEGQNLQLSPQLRKQNRIRTIQSTLAIEGNSLSIDQVTAIIEGKRVLGQQREIAEVQGAIRAYETLTEWNPGSIEDLLQAHYLLMSNILVGAGKFRKDQVGIHKGSHVVHIAPPAKRVPHLMEDLMTWLKTSDSHALIKSCVFHYELEFIHPFMDGNGRMGRLWQTLILGQWNELFYLLPIESLVKDQQERYYQTLEAADQAASSTVFIEFMLDIIDTLLMQNGAIDQVSDQVSDQVKNLLSIMDNQYWSAQELMKRLSLSHSPTFRKNYLNPALKAGLLLMQYPDKPRSPKQRYKKAD